MATDAIFLISSNGLERVPQSGYATEAVLQEMISRYPDVLSGDQIDPEAPPRWLLVTREAGVPDSDGASDRWSADHLLIDQFATPTFVEVKRASDTRIRREVVGQMLEYAANSVRYWPPGRIRAAAERHHGGPEELSAKVLDLLGEVEEGEAVNLVEDFWQGVDSNLAAGRVRLLFVADELPRELRRLIEFLNEKMEDVQVLGVELRQYAGAALKALVPRVVGQTERARIKDTARARASKTTRQEFMDSCPEWAQELFGRVIGTAETEGHEISWGTKGFTFRVIRPTGQKVSLFYGYPAGAVGHDRPFIEVFLKEVTDEEGAGALRQKLAANPSFQEKGRFTLRCRMSQGSVKDIDDILPAVFELARRIRGLP